MHHMIRTHIMHESSVENFVAAIDYSQTATRFAQKVRRLSLNFGNAEDATLSTNMRLSQVRTLAFFGAFKCVPSFTEFRLLQVLILHFWGEEESIRFDLTSISEIFRMRYLKVTSNVNLEIHQMHMLGRLQYLETLKIDAARGSRITCDIVYLPRLLHLSLPAGTIFLSGVGHMTSLRTLGHFDLSTNIDIVRDLGGLTNVQDLQLTYTQELGLTSYLFLVNLMECLNSVLGKLNNLKFLTLKNSGFMDFGIRLLSISCDVLSSISSPPALLQRLEWLPRLCTFSSLPKWIGHLDKLCILKIGIRELVGSDVDILKGLTALTYLSLYVRTKPADIIVFSKGEFLVLKYLKFNCSVPRLKFEADVMPNLRTLKLGFDAHGAIQYVPIPAGLEHLSGLNEISAKIGGTTASEPVRRIVESALSDAVRMHPGRPTVNIRCVDQLFGDKDDQAVRLQEKKHMTPQRQHERIEDEQHATLQKSSREDAASRGGRGSIWPSARVAGTHGQRSHVRASTFVDSYSWSKYGQKNIHGAKHHRSYYRCTYRKSQGCAATKQVQQTDEGQLFDITYRGNHTCVPSASLLQLEPQRTSVPLTVEIPPYPLQLEPQCSVSFSSLFPGSSSVRNQATPESQITYRTPTSDIQQNVQEDAWVDDSDYSDSDSNQRPYSHRPQKEHMEADASQLQQGADALLNLVMGLAARRNDAASSSGVPRLTADSDGDMEVDGDDPKDDDDLGA